MPEGEGGEGGEGDMPMEDDEKDGEMSEEQMKKMEEEMANMTPEEKAKMEKDMGEELPEVGGEPTEPAAEAEAETKKEDL
jgi:hypothetical protein